MTGRDLSEPGPRVVVCTALLAYCGGILMLALFPTDSITWGEWMVAAMTVLASIGLVARMTPAITVPGEEFAYLIVGFVGFSTLLLYLLSHPEPAHVEVRVTALLLTGVIGAYGAYLAQDD